MSAYTRLSLIPRAVAHARRYAVSSIIPRSASLNRECYSTSTCVTSGISVAVGKPHHITERLTTTGSGQRGQLRCRSISSLPKFENPKVESFQTEEDGRFLNVQWEDGTQSRYHSIWLRYCCLCDKCKQAASNQGIGIASQMPETVRIKDAAISDSGNVQITWKDDDHVTVLSTFLLLDNSYSKAALEARRKARAPLFHIGNEIPEMTYEEMKSSDHGLYKYAKTINDHGLCLLRGVPTEEGSMKKVIELLGPIEVTIYGELFNVLVEHPPRNAAFSSAYLDFHMDQQVYESPPGVQFLHCLIFDETVKDGETTFADVFHAAEEFRQKYPEGFSILSRVPSTFTRIHYSRDAPVHMLHRRPTFALNCYDEIIGVNWHPNVVGPHLMAEEDVEPYFQAHLQFAKCIQNSPTKKEIRFKPGDMIAFENRRMVHGRKMFSEESNGKRFLQGSYMSLDDFRSKLHLLSLAIGDGNPPRRSGENSWI